MGNSSTSIDEVNTVLQSCCTPAHAAATVKVGVDVGNHIGECCEGHGDRGLVHYLPCGPSTYPSYSSSYPRVSFLYDEHFGEKADIPTLEQKSKKKVKWDLLSPPPDLPKDGESLLWDPRPQGEPPARQGMSSPWQVVANPDPDHASPWPLLESDQADAKQFAGPEGLERLLAERRSQMAQTTRQQEAYNKRNNKYGAKDACLPKFDKSRHVPTLALINPMSGAKVGRDILSLARQSPIYSDRFFDIVATCQDAGRGGLLDLFRIELNAAKEEASKLNTRPRVISGGGDGTGSFTLHMVFLALQADNSRAEEGLKDTGNGFIWSDEEMASSFPAIAQMPLGSANDFANIIGWGQKFPGSTNSCRSVCSGCSATCNRWTRQRRLKSLLRWMEIIIDPATQVSNFDVWGIMPSSGADACNFKLCELGGQRGRNPKTKVDGKQQLTMKEAGRPTPFFILLYFSTGFGAYLCSRFSINRRSTPFRNRLEYIRQILGMVTERSPPQVNCRTQGVRINCSGGRGGDGQASAYFPPRRGKKTKGSRYREVGFYNINWQAHLLHGADRAPLIRRCFFGRHRRPVKFNDGLLDMYRMRFKSYFKNPGSKMQTDKRKDMTLTFEATQGKGIFVQYDGEARFVFSPTGEQFSIHIRKVLNIPVVIGPYCKESLTGNLKEQQPVTFEMCGDTSLEKDRVRARILKSLRGELDPELNATSDEIKEAQLPLFEANPLKKSPDASARKNSK